jgi:hypothetical protein
LRQLNIHGSAVDGFENPVYRINTPPIDAHHSKRGMDAHPANQYYRSPRSRSVTQQTF